MWHQLTDKLVEFVGEEHFVKHPNELVDLYTKFVADFDYKLNSLKLAHIMVETSKKIQGK